MPQSPSVRLVRESVVYDMVKAIMLAGTAVTITPNDGTKKLTVASTATGGTANPSNIYMQPVWSGSGAHPLRGTLPAGFFCIWRQPSAPLTTTGYALPGDEWEVTE